MKIGSALALILSLSSTSVLGQEYQRIADRIDRLACYYAQAAKAPAGSFPKEMQGIWTDSPNTCLTFKMRSLAFLKDAAKKKTASGFGLMTITGTEVTGTNDTYDLMSGKFLLQVNAKTVHVLDVGNPNINVDSTLTQEGFLDVTVVGARASATYLKCR